MNYKETLEYLSPSFQQVGASAYKPGLARSVALDNQMQNPHREYHTIHVAGTNGKGSVSHLLAAVLRSANYKVGLYTSPHLVDFCERIRVNGKKISKRYVIEYVERYKSFIKAQKPSFFELTTGLAFEFFRHKKVDFAIIEVGLGGRLDSTNIINPLLSVITNISFDHTQYLGNTLTQIAAEKAGIMKPYVPVVIGEIGSEEIKHVFGEKAKTMKSPVYFAETEKVLTSAQKLKNGKWEFSSTDYGRFNGELKGLVQKQNARTVLTALRLLETMHVKIPHNAVKKAFAHVTELTGLAGRWQTIHTKPLIICDTGHNIGAWESLTIDLQQAAKKHQTLRIIFGVVNDKDIEPVLAILPKAAVYYFTQASINRSLPVRQLTEKTRNFHLQGKSFDTVREAVKAAIKDAHSKDMIFIGGSTFVVADALPLFSTNYI